jgi:EAL domain-containing protein (putative c-di-GMP-specific phosphodiesterase class I)
MTGSGAVPRYLGYIFASSDLVFEIHETGRVHNVMGAASLLTGRDPAALEGQAWPELFLQYDREVIQQMLSAMRPGVRKGPVRVRLTHPDKAPSDAPMMGLSIFQAADGQPVSASLSMASAPDLPRMPASPNGLLSAAEMEEDLSGLLSQIRSDGGKVQVEMLEMGDLARNLAHLKPHDRSRLQQRVHASLRAASARGGSAVDLGADRFVILADRANPGANISHTLEKLGAEFGVTLKPQHEIVALDDDLTPDQSVRALKVALDIFTKDGINSAAKTLKEVIETTSAKSRKICEIVKQDHFELLFQPIVGLQDGALHHYEALARLGGANESPAEAMRLAEELGIVDKFDFAVAEQAIRVLRDRADDGLKIAINVSPYTFMKQGYVEFLLNTLREMSVEPRQLLVELTETVPIDDFETARSRIEQLRGASIKFCLDDMGSGAASLDYLRQLPFDYVKLDGKFVSGLVSDRRSQLLIQNMVGLCKALGGQVVAEQIETADVADLLKAAGVSLGQGWLYGRAAPLPPLLAAESAPVAAPATAPSNVRPLKRAGAKERWG